MRFDQRKNLWKSDDIKQFCGTRGTESGAQGIRSAFMLCFGLCFFFRVDRNWMAHKHTCNSGDGPSELDNADFVNLNLFSKSCKIHTLRNVLVTNKWSNKNKKSGQKKGNGNSSEETKSFHENPNSDIHLIQRNATKIILFPHFRC